MRNEILYDAAGVPNIMVTFTPEELGLPDVLRGRKVAEYLIGKYMATVIGGVPLSLPYQKPATGISFDDAVKLCEAKGPGWHLFTNDEWAAVARLSLRNNTLPRGNTDCGNSHSHPEGGILAPNACGCLTLTGSGPVTWNHDHTEGGIADLCGGAWEHVGGARFLDGQIQVIPDNGAAAGADQSRDSAEWTPICGKDGKPVYYVPDNGGIRLQTSRPGKLDWGNAPFAYLYAEPDVDPQALDKLKSLALYPEDGYDDEGSVFVDDNGERIVCRGGNWYLGVHAGVFSLSGGSPRGGVSTDIGFRLAYVRYSDESGNLADTAAERREDGAHD